MTTTRVNPAVLRTTRVVTDALSDADLELLTFHALIDSRLLEVPPRVRALVVSLYTEWDGQRLHTETRLAVLALGNARAGGAS